MKRGLILFIGISLGIGCARPLFAEDESIDPKPDLWKGSNTESVRNGNSILNDIPPSPLGQIRARNGSAMRFIQDPMVEIKRKVSVDELKKALKKEDVKRTHFSEQNKQPKSAPAQMRGTVVSGSSLKREYVPMVESERPYLSISNRGK